jgi:hypothetical protein
MVYAKSVKTLLMSLKLSHHSRNLNIKAMCTGTTSQRQKLPVAIWIWVQYCGMLFFTEESNFTERLTRRQWNVIDGITGRLLRAIPADCIGPNNATHRSNWNYTTLGFEQFKKSCTLDLSSIVISISRDKNHKLMLPRKQLCHKYLYAPGIQIISANQAVGLDTKSNYRDTFSL